jgi:PAS domain S-box-containing protein
MKSTIPLAASRLPAFLTAAAIFAADWATGFGAALSTLYLAPPLLVARSHRAGDIRWSVIGCAGLAIVSWEFVHAGRPTADDVIRLLLIIAALVATGELFVTRRKLGAIQAELGESRAELLKFTDSVPYLLWRATREGGVDFLNRQYTELTGHDHKTAIAEKNWKQWIHPDDLGPYLAIRDAALVKSSEMRATFRLLHADGEYRWMSLIGRPVDISETGEAACWYGGIADAHEEVLAQQKVRDLMATLEQRVEQRTAELVQSRERFATLWEISNITFAEQDFSEAIVILDRLKAEGVADLAAYFADHPDVLAQCVARVRTVNVNPAMAKLLGYDSIEELAAQPVVQATEDIGAVLLRQFELPFYGRDQLDGRAVLIGKDDRRVPIFYTVHRLPDERQLSCCLDLTHQHRAEEMRLAAQEELARANRLATVGAFSASVAHELNQPIASILMDARTGLRYMQREEPDMEAAVRILERLARSAERIAGIVQRIRENIAGGELQSSWVDVGKLVHEVADLLQRDVRNAHAVLEVHCASGLPQVRANAVDLQQILVNLIINAAEAMADWNGERRITVRVARVVDAVAVSVADTGRGFDPNHRERMFEPFFTTKAAGIGMGLQICRAAVEKLGGELSARNRPEGGAEFLFTTPVGVSEGATARTPEPTPARSCCIPEVQPQ